MRMPYVIVGEARSPRDLQDAMDALVRINVGQLRRLDIPRIYASGVVYERERRRAPLEGVERFQTALDAYRLGHGDCDGLAPWRAAEIIVREGRPARARVIPSPGVGYHVVVERPDGRVEDPSAVLGMLDGVSEDIPEDAIESAATRRKRRGRRLLGVAKKLFGRAKKAVRGTPQARLLTRAASEAAEASRAMLERPRGQVDAPARRGEDDES